MATETLSSIDRAWLRMEDPTHPMMITVLLVFGAPIEFERLQAVVSDRLLRYPRFRQRVVQDQEQVEWQDAPALDLGQHLRQTSLPAPADEGALRAVVGELMSQQLDFSRPLWQFHLIGPYGSGCALVGRVHHCLADGPALLQVLLALTDGQPDLPLPDTLFEEPAAGIVAQGTELLVRKGFNILSNPFRLRGLARLGTGTMAAMGKLLWRSPDPDTIFRGRLGVPKQVAWSRPVPLAEVKAAGRGVGGTVNDVMLAAATGALRRYLVARGEPVQGLTIRAGLSVNLREPNGYTLLGNRAGAVLVDLPVGLDSATERLRQIKRNMDQVKSSPEASVVWALMNALGNAPAGTQQMLVETYCTRETAVIANMPGPEDVVSLAGAPLSALIFWVPALGGTGLCLSIASYAGQVWFAVGADQGLIPDPEELVGGFHAEFEVLQHTVQEPARARVQATTNKDVVEAMNAMLDEAIAKVDELLEGQ